MFAALFYVYVFVGAPILLGALRRTLSDHTPAYVLGCFLLIAIAAGFVGLRLKCRAVAADLKENVALSTRQALSLVAVWILHATVCIMLAMTALTAFGIHVAGPNAAAGWIAAAVLLVVGVEFWACAWIFCVRPYPIPFPRAKVMAGELCLLVFGCVVYTAYWEYLEINQLHDYTWIVFFFESVAVAVIFLVAYLPIKLPDLIGEFFLEKPSGRGVRLAGMVAIGLVAAVYPPILRTLCEGGRYTSLAAALAKPAQVKKLYLNRQNLTQLPVEIGLLTNVRILMVAENKLTELPPQIGAMCALRELYLGNNQLQYLPPELGRLSNLVVLSAYDNYLARIPDELAGATNLQTINLRWNSLTNLPPVLGKLPCLRMVDLTGNHIPPEELANLPAGAGTE